MIVLDLEAFKGNEKHISGDAILKARDEANRQVKHSLAHFDFNGELISYPSDAVIFMEKPNDHQVLGIIHPGRLSSFSLNYVYNALVTKSSQYDLWNGESIFDLISVLQKGANQRDLEQLSALIAYRPTVLQSKRLTQSVLKKYRCGEEASKAFHFYIDQSGYALITMRDVKHLFELFCGDEKYMTRNFHAKELNKVGYYLCSESDLPSLLSLCKADNFRNEISKEPGKDVYKIEGIPVQKIDLTFEVHDVKIKPSRIKSSIPLNEYGYTAKQVQYAMESICNERYITARTLAYTSGMSLTQLSDFVDIAVRDKLIESVHIDAFTYSSVEPFQFTIKGNALSMKRGGKRMNKTALKKQMSIIVERYLDSRKHIDKMVRVPNCLGFFGSSINKDAVDYGDLDVFFTTEISKLGEEKIYDFIKDRPNSDPALVYRHLLSQAYSSELFPIKPPSVPEYSRLDGYAERVARSFLKRNSKLISIHDLDDVSGIDADFEVHYIGDEKLDKPITDYYELRNALSRFID
ncbi:hypothetical protein F0M16_21825 [Vibrio cholerae]|uniref:Uncharacterized protein n=1 Tax=Vibrio cholerae TaxID=666 RepID=A0A5Q6PCP9_VIBCL|nr:hypothetical protein [Vibrio cholerae]KAA1252644.1 hypothetical protein F0M16_21825 [Vibrio cholerae]